jgi:hypothetical protein
MIHGRIFCSCKHDGVCAKSTRSRPKHAGQRGWTGRGKAMYSACPPRWLGLLWKVDCVHLAARACTPVSMAGGKDRFVAQGFRGRQRRNERKTVWGRERAGRIECPVRVALAHATHWGYKRPARAVRYVYRWAWMKGKTTSMFAHRCVKQAMLVIRRGTSFVVSSAPEPLGAQGLPVGPDTRYRSERKTPREDDTLRTIGRAWRRIAIGVWGLGGAPPVTIDEADVVMRGAAQKRRSMRR